MSLTLALVVAVLFGVGTFLILQRTLTRVIFGLGVLGHGANLLLQLAGGRAGRPPVVGDGDGTQIVGQAGGSGFVDPMPQALALTAIVISFGVTAYLLAMAYRSWVLHRSDEVEDDVEDRRIARSQASEPAGGEQRVRASASEPAGGEQP
jgi:multicomponent Na+:H+ antiporter subunit C